MHDASKGRNACVLFTPFPFIPGLVPSTLVKGVCHTHPEERRKKRSPVDFSARRVEGELPTQWCVVGSAAEWGGGEGRVSHGGDGRGSRLRTIARRATVCRARPGSEGRSDDRKDRGERRSEWLENSRFAVSEFHVRDFGFCTPTSRVWYRNNSEINRRIYQVPVEFVTVSKLSLSLSTTYVISRWIKGNIVRRRVNIEVARFYRAAGAEVKVKIESSVCVCARVFVASKSGSQWIFPQEIVRR